jgi:metallophosphoesterase superfamily enzyme
MPRGGACGFCSLPKAVLDESLDQWRAGMGAVNLSRWLSDRGYPLSTPIISNCLNRARHHGARSHDIADSGAVQARLGRIADLLERSGIAPEDVGKVQSVRISEWQGLTKNEDGEAELHDLSGASIVLSPTWDTGPAWPVVQPAKPCTIKPPKPRTVALSDGRTAVILPDIQVGFRRDLQLGTLDPFHDELAMAAALAVIRLVQPDLIVFLGDGLDFAQFGTFDQEAAFAGTVQPAIDRMHRYIVECKAAAPHAHVVFIEGNHDRRLQKAVERNALAAFGLRRAELPDEWPVLSVPNLLRLDELDVKYVGGYPAGVHWLNDRICVIHGHKVRSTGSTAAAVVDDERVSVIFGHVHRIEQSYRTRRVRDGHRTSLAASPGCLCRIDGAVPSTKGSTDPLGRPIVAAENWQQGVAVVTYEEGDGPFGLELVPIFDGVAHFRGERIAA